MTFNENTANDNSSAAPFGGDRVGQQFEARDRVYKTLAQQSKTGRAHSAATAPSSLPRPQVFYAAFSLWVFSLIGVFMAIDQFSSPNPRIMAFVVSGWAALFLAYVSKHQNKNFFRDLGLSSAFGALGIALLTAISGYNIPVSAPFLIISALVLTVGFAALLKERYFLTLSAMIAMSWSALSLLSPDISKYHWMFPAIWALQMSLAIEFKAKLPLALIAISGFLWLAILLFTQTIHHNISALMAISAMFSFGIAYSRLGKSMQDSQVLSGLFQTNIGWAIAAISALLLQDYWLMQTPHAPWIGITNNEFTSYPYAGYWKVFTMLTIAAVGLFCAFRSHMKKQTFTGGIGITIFAALLPSSIIFKPQLTALATQYSINMFPTVGLVIGGAVTALSLAMLANGLRRNKTSMLLLALLALCAEAVLVMDSLYGEPNNQMIFGFTILVIAMTTALYAHNGFTRNTFDRPRNMHTYA